MTTNDIERYVQKRSKRNPEFIQAWENSHSKHEALRQVEQQQPQQHEHLSERGNLVASHNDFLPIDDPLAGYAKLAL